MGRTAQDIEALRRIQLGRSGDIGANDTEVGASHARNGDYYQAIQYNRDDWEARQAVAANRLSATEYNDWRYGRKGSVVQRWLGLTGADSGSGDLANLAGGVTDAVNDATGVGSTSTVGRVSHKFWHQTGSALETGLDIMSLGLYGSAALAHGMTDFAVHAQGKKDEGFLPEFYANSKDGYGVVFHNFLNRGSMFSFGISPTAAVDAWHSKEEYTKFLADYGYDTGMAGGLALDILMDPLTYMTMGVESGTRLLAAEGIQLGKKALQAGERLTVSSFGKKVAKLAARDLMPEFAAKVGDANKARYYLGGDRLHMLDATMAAEWQQKLTKQMVEHFPRYRQELANEAIRTYKHTPLGSRPTALGLGLPLKPGGAPGMAWNAAKNAWEATATGAAQAARVMPWTETFKNVTLQHGAVLGSGRLQATSKAFSKYAAEDMFHETATGAWKERGLNNLFGMTREFGMRDAQKVLSKAPYFGHTFEKAFDVFDRGWDAHPDVVSAKREHLAKVRTVIDGHVRRFMPELAHLNDEERRYLSLSIEASHAADIEKQGIPLAFFDPTTKEGKARAFFKGEMERIFQEERDAGIPVGEIQNYISHMYLDPNHRRMVLDTVKSLPERYDTSNKFIQSRIIATLFDAENILGEGRVQTDALKILAYRQRASTEMIERARFMDYIRKEHGVAAELLEKLKTGVMDSSAARAFMARTAQSNQFVLPYRQVWRDGRGRLTQLGFRENDMPHNLRLLEFLQATPEERFGPKVEDLKAMEVGPKGSGREAVDVRALQKARDHQAFAERAKLPEEARMFGKPLPKEISWKPAPKTGFTYRGAGRQVHPDAGDFKRIKIQAVLKALSSTDDPMWKAILQTDVAGGRMSTRNLEGLLVATDRYMKTHLDSHLEAFMPQIQVVLGQVLDANGLGTKEAKDKLAKMFENMAVPLEVRRMEPVLPQVMIDLCEQTRVRNGDVSSLVPVTKWQRTEIEREATRIGMTPSQLKRATQLVLGKETIDSHAEANLIHSVLLGHGEGGVNMLQDPGLVRVSIDFPVREQDPYHGMNTNRGDLEMKEASPAGRAGQDVQANLRGDLRDWAPEDIPNRDIDPGGLPRARIELVDNTNGKSSIPLRSGKGRAFKSMVMDAAPESSLDNFRKYWAPDALAKEMGDPTKRIIYMDATEFRGLALREGTSTNLYKEKNLGELVASKSKAISKYHVDADTARITKQAGPGKIQDLPFLEVQVQDDGAIKVVHHDGRHRMHQFAGTGNQRIPVVVKLTDGNTWDNLPDAYGIVSQDSFGFDPIEYKLPYTTARHELPEGVVSKYVDDARQLLEDPEAETPENKEFVAAATPEVHKLYRDTLANIFKEVRLDHDATIRLVLSTPEQIQEAMKDPAARAGVVFAGNVANILLQPPKTAEEAATTMWNLYHEASHVILEWSENKKEIADNMEGLLQNIEELVNHSGDSSSERLVQTLPTNTSMTSEDSSGKTAAQQALEELSTWGEEVRTARVMGIHEDKWPALPTSAHEFFAEVGAEHLAVTSAAGEVNKVNQSLHAGRFTDGHVLSHVKAKIQTAFFRIASNIRNAFYKVKEGYSKGGSYGAGSEISILSGIKEQLAWKERQLNTVMSNHQLNPSNAMEERISELEGQISEIKAKLNPTDEVPNSHTQNRILDVRAREADKRSNFKMEQAWSEEDPARSAIHEKDAKSHAEDRDIASSAVNETRPRLSPQELIDLKVGGGDVRPEESIVGRYDVMRQYIDDVLSGKIKLRPGSGEAAYQSKLTDLQDIARDRASMTTDLRGQGMEPGAPGTGAEEMASAKARLRAKEQSFGLNPKDSDYQDKLAAARKADPEWAVLHAAVARQRHGASLNLKAGLEKLSPEDKQAVEYYTTQTRKLREIQARLVMVRKGNPGVYRKLPEYKSLIDQAKNIRAGRGEAHPAMMARGKELFDQLKQFRDVAYSNQEVKQSARLESKLLSFGRPNVAPNGRPMAETRQGVSDVISAPKTYSVDYMLPAGVAKEVKDLFDQGAVSRERKDWERAFLFKWDAFQKFTKSQTMNSIGGFHGRNMFSNIMKNMMVIGWKMLDPDHVHDWLTTLWYALTKDSDLHDSLGAIPFGDWLGTAMKSKQEVIDHLGSQKLKAAGGREMTVKDFVDHAMRDGILHNGSTHDLNTTPQFSTMVERLLRSRGNEQGVKEMIGRLPGMLAHGAAGAAFGAANGAVAGTALDQVTDPSQAADDLQKLGFSAEMASKIVDWAAPSNVMSLMGLIAGGLLGARAVGGDPLRQVGILNKSSALIQSGWRPFMRVGEAATEMPFKLAMALHEFKQTSSLAAAKDRVFTHMNDWTGMSAVERRIFRRFFDFYGWTKLALKSTMDTVWTNPKRLQLEGEFFRQSMLAQKDIDPEDLPDWLHEKLVMIGDRAKDHTHQLLVSPGTEAEEVAKLVGEGISWENTVGRSARAIQAPLSYLANKDSFTGEPVWLDLKHGVIPKNKSYQFEAAPAWLRKMVNYQPATPDKEATVDPRLTWALGQTPYSRFLQIAEHIQTTEGEPDYRSLARNLLGVSVYRFDPATGQYFQNKARIEAMETILTNLGVMRHYKGTVDVDKGDVDWSKSGKHRKKSR
jgi:hypothetical protein